MGEKSHTDDHCIGFLRIDSTIRHNLDRQPRLWRFIRSKLSSRQDKVSPHSGILSPRLVFISTRSIHFLTIRPSRWNCGRVPGRVERSWTLLRSLCPTICSMASLRLSISTTSLYSLEAHIPQCCSMIHHSGVTAGRTATYTPVVRDS